MYLISPHVIVLFRLVGAGLKDVSIYIRRAKASIVVDAAASAWACGVPWAEALRISQAAMDHATEAMPPPIRRRAKGRGKGKA